MIRIFWIVGLVIALMMFVFMTAICALALIKLGHLNLKGWVMLVSGVYGVRLIFDYLRLKVLEGRSSTEDHLVDSH
jgi:hypothetical protein